MRNGPLANIPIGEPRVLIAADLERLRERRHVPTTPQKLRESHHMIARFAALGLDNHEVGARTGYSRERVGVLLEAPAMKELVALYRGKIDETYVKQVDTFFELATGNMLAAERHIADTIAELDEKDELLPVRTALAISRDAADRFGFGKHTSQTNINVDFAAKLEAAIARSGKGPTIEASVAAHPPTRSVPPPSARPTREIAERPQPLLRRRA